MEIKSIAIEVTRKAFLPESYAYCDYFRKQGFFCKLVEKGSDELLDYDAVILFHGFHPFWRKYPEFIVGEYHSLSTGSYGRFKDVIKRIFNVKSDLYIFLNEDIRQKMWFLKETNYITRGMGYNKTDFEEYASEEKKFDIVYCGSYRDGLLDEINKIADLGFSIAVVGLDIPFKHNNLTILGRLTPKEARKVMSQSRYGLNYTPDIFPLNIQDSTKVIEYCAAGLGVITNRYEWVNNFEKLRGARFLSLTDVKNREDVLKFDFLVPNVEDLDWSIILKDIKLEKV